MSVTTQVNNIVIEPVDLRFGNQHLVCFDTVAGTSLGADYVAVSSKTVDYYVWFNTGADTDPAPSGKTELVEVSILSGDSAVQVATKMATAINTVSATTGIHAKAKANEGKVLVEVKDMGAPLSAAGAGTSTMVATIINQGSELPLGYIDGNVELAVAGTFFDVTAHQTGSELISKLLTGTELGPLTVTLKETVAAKLKEFLEVLGGEVTPAGGTAVTAIGALAGTKQFTNVFAYSKMLVMHPTKNDADDYSGDFAFWVSYPNINNLMISGEEDRKLEIEFSFFLDEKRVNEASKMVYGDWTQNFLKA